MNIKMLFGNIIRGLPIPVVQRMKLERSCAKVYRRFRKMLGLQNENEISFFPMVWNNRLYGDEFLLRRYADLTEDLYAVIEHGLFLGRNSAMLSLKHEWELGCILTGGNYRKDLITEFYPNHYCEAIGPMLHYARVDDAFRKEIMEKLDPGERTALLLPMHGNDFFNPVYDFEESTDKMIREADKRDCKNIILCVYYRHIPMFEELVQKYRFDRKIAVTTNGNRYNEDFMDRQKTQLGLADFTISNSLGTHVGYCVYMGKPHVILPQEHKFVGDEKAMERDFGNDNRSANYYEDYAKEEEMFFRLFNPEVTCITDEQYKLCDYYWGFGLTKTPEQIREIARNCETHAKEFARLTKAKSGGGASALN